VCARRSSATSSPTRTVPEASPGIPAGKPDICLEEKNPKSPKDNRGHQRARHRSSRLVLRLILADLYCYPRDFPTSTWHRAIEVIREVSRAADTSISSLDRSGRAKNAACCITYIRCSHDDIASSLPRRCASAPEHNFQFASFRPSPRYPLKPDSLSGRLCCAACCN